MQSSFFDAQFFLFQNEFKNMIQKQRLQHGYIFLHRIKIYNSGDQKLDLSFAEISDTNNIWW